MTTTTTELHPLAEAYVKELKDAARRMPRTQRNELVAEIRSHLAETAPATASQAEVLTALERLGEPAEILAEQGAEAAAPPRGLGLHEIAAILLLMFGAFLFLVGWLGGVVLLWSSRRWTTRDKLIGTFVVPGGYFGAAFAGIATSSTTSCFGSGRHVTCVGGPSTAAQIGQIALGVFLLLGPLASALYLARRAR